MLPHLFRVRLAKQRLIVQQNSKHVPLHWQGVWARLVYSTFQILQVSYQGLLDKWMSYSVALSAEMSACSAAARAISGSSTSEVTALLPSRERCKCLVKWCAESMAFVMGASARVGFGIADTPKGAWPGCEKR